MGNDSSDHLDGYSRRRYWTKGRGKRSPREVTRTDRQLEALEWRKQGLDYYVIGEKMGVSHTQAMNYIKGGLEATIAARNESGEELLKMELSRLDHFMQSIWPKIERGDLAAIDRGIRIMERRAKLIGLDAPEKREMLGNKDKPLQLEHSLDPTNLSDEALNELISAKKRDSGSSQSET